MEAQKGDTGGGVFSVPTSVQHGKAAMRCPPLPVAVGLHTERRGCGRLRRTAESQNLDTVYASRQVTVAVMVDDVLDPALST